MKSNATAHGSHGSHGSTKQYVYGYLLSLILTLLPLYAVMNHLFSDVWQIVVIIGLAIAQMAIQLFFFMHVTEKEGDGPQWHVTGLILGFVIVFTIVAGSIWVMSFNSQVQ
ncbi:MAG: cytochrome o ubiquinol oxidase subunit IV [Tumebacillaceae bacterium]